MKHPTGNWAWACERMLAGVVVSPNLGDGSPSVLRYGIKDPDGERNVCWWFSAHPSRYYPLELDADAMTAIYVEAP